MNTITRQTPISKPIPLNGISEGSVVILTGASSGLGKQLAIRLAIITGRNAERLQQTKQACESLMQAKIGTFEGDLSDRSVCEQLIAKVTRDYQRIDVLILNAGINAHFHLAELKDLSVYDRLMRTNFYANVYLTKYALSWLRKSQGTIVVISSISGKLGLPDRSAYCASKFALTGFFESLRTEEDSISICMVYPTSLDTPMRDNDIMGAPKISSQSQSKQQSAEKAAELIIRNMRKGQKDLFIPGKLWVGTLLQPLFPNFMRNKVRQQAKL